MDISINKLFIYDKVYQLLHTRNSCFCYKQDNGPMYKRPIKIHKGIENSVKFRVFDPDKSPVNLSNYTVYFRIFNSESRELVLEKRCQRLPAAGVIEALFTESDLQELPIGYYRLVVLATISSEYNDSYKTAFAMNADFDNNIEITLEITDQAERIPFPSFEITEWTQNTEIGHQGPNESYYFSSAIPSARSKNRQGSNCTFSMLTNSFTGYLEVYATLDHIPSTNINRGWYKVEIEPGKNRIEFVNFTGNEYFTFTDNAMWYRIVYSYADVENPGELKKVLVRS